MIRTATEGRAQVSSALSWDETTSTSWVGLLDYVRTISLESGKSSVVCRPGKTNISPVGTLLPHGSRLEAREWDHKIAYVTRNAFRFLQLLVFVFSNLLEILTRSLHSRKLSRLFSFIWLCVAKICNNAILLGPMI